AREYHAPWHHQLGRVYAALKRVDDAEASYRAALDIDGVFAPALYDLGALLHQNDKSGEAIVVLERLCAADPNYRDAYWMLATAHRSVFNIVQAIAAYRSHLALFSHSSMAHITLGLVLADAGHFDEAIERITCGMDLDPANIAVGHLEIGNVLLRHGKQAEAR